MPLIFITRSGSTPISNMASIMRSEMALWPQPAHSVDLPPRYSTIGKADVIHLRARGPTRSCGGHYKPSLVANSSVMRARVDRQSVVVQNAAQLHHLLGGKIQLQQARQLRVAVLLHHVNALMAGHKVVNLVRERIGADAHVVHAHACAPSRSGRGSRAARNRWSRRPGSRSSTLPFFTATGAGTSLRAFSNLRASRSITAWYSSGRSV